MQITRGVELLKDGSRSQLQFLHDFARENAILTVGGYNYTTSDAQLAIPNVPIDASAFAETALVYSALMGHAPSNAMVAKLTLTPYFEVRPLAERARMIMEMPAYAYQYDHALPEVDFIGVESGRLYPAGESHTISVEAVSLGADELSGTYDDGRVLSVELFLNGKSYQRITSMNGAFFYQFNLGADLPSGEYRMEVVAEDANGLIGRAERLVTLRKTNDLQVKLTGPDHGSIFERGSTAVFSYSVSEDATAYLEIDGRVQWSGNLAFSEPVFRWMNPFLF